MNPKKEAQSIVNSWLDKVSIDKSLWNIKSAESMAIFLEMIFEEVLAARTLRDSINTADEKDYHAMDAYDKIRDRNERK